MSVQTEVNEVHARVKDAFELKRYPLPIINAEMLMQFSSQAQEMRTQNPTGALIEAMRISPYVAHREYVGMLFDCLGLLGHPDSEWISIVEKEGESAQQEGDAILVRATCTYKSHYRHADTAVLALYSDSDPNGVAPNALLVSALDGTPTFVMHGAIMGEIAQAVMRNQAST